MASRRTPLPLPQTWLPRKAWSGKDLSVHDTMLAGSVPSLGTKAYFRSLLLQGGWDSANVDACLTGKFRAVTRLYDPAEIADRREPDVSLLRNSLKEKGFLGEPVVWRASWQAELWSSYTSHPWWVAASGGHRVAAMVGPTVTILERGSVSFLYDMWLNLGEAPDTRFPVFRRLNLLSWCSPDAIRRFEETVGRDSDIIFLYGGLVDADHLHETLGYVSALSSVFRGLLVVEIPVDETVSPAARLAAVRRAGIHTYLGLGSNVERA